MSHAKKEILEVKKTEEKNIASNTTIMLTTKSNKSFQLKHLDEWVLTFLYSPKIALAVRKAFFSMLLDTLQFDSATKLINKILADYPVTDNAMSQLCIDYLAGKNSELAEGNGNFQTLLMDRITIILSNKETAKSDKSIIITTLLQIQTMGMKKAILDQMQNVFLMHGQGPMLLELHNSLIGSSSVTTTSTSTSSESKIDPAVLEKRLHKIVDFIFAENHQQALADLEHLSLSERTAALDLTVKAYGYTLLELGLQSNNEQLLTKLLDGVKSRIQIVVLGRVNHLNPELTHKLLTKLEITPEEQKQTTLESAVNNILQIASNQSLAFENKLNKIEQIFKGLSHKEINEILENFQVLAAQLSEYELTMQIQILLVERMSLAEAIKLEVKTQPVVRPEAKGSETDPVKIDDKKTEVVKITKPSQNNINRTDNEVTKLLRAINSKDAAEIIRIIRSSSQPVKLLTEIIDPETDIAKLLKISDSTVMDYIFDNLENEYLRNLGKEILKLLDPEVGNEVLVSIYGSIDSEPKNSYERQKLDYFASLQLIVDALFSLNADDEIIAVFNAIKSKNDALVLQLLGDSSRQVELLTEEVDCVINPSDKWMLNDSVINYIFDNLKNDDFIETLGVNIFKLLDAEDAEKVLVCVEDDIQDEPEDAEEINRTNYFIRLRDIKNAKKKNSTDAFEATKSETKSESKTEVVKTTSKADSDTVPAFSYADGSPFTIFSGHKPSKPSEDEDHTDDEDFTVSY